MRQGWWKLTCIQSAGLVSMPVVLVGHSLAKMSGTFFAISMILIGNGILCLLAFLIGNLAIKFRVSTSETVAALGGKALSQIFALAMMVSMLGWFAIQSSILVRFLQDVFPKIPSEFLMIFLGISLVLAVMGDSKRLFWLSEKTAPLAMGTFFCTFVWILWNYKSEIQTTEDSVHFASALSIILATSLGVVIDIPTFYRFAISRKQAWFSLILVLGIGTSLVEILGVLLSDLYSEETLFSSYFGILMMACGWAMNVNNLYSAVVSSQTLTSRGNFLTRSLFLGSLALIPVFMHWSESLILWMEGISLGISSMGGILVTCALRRTEDMRIFRNIIFGSSFLIGLVFGILSMTKTLILTGAVQVDAFLIAFLFSNLGLEVLKQWSLRISTKTF